MTILTDHPVLLSIMTLLVLSFSAWLGSFVSKKRRLGDSDMGSSFGVVEAATLTLLGLIIGFTFSLSLSLYEQRKSCEEKEANAIGTEYLRAGLVPAAEAARLRGLLLSYLDQRILFYEAGSEQELLQINALTGQLQTELWSAVQNPAVARPDPVIALAVAGMNDVIDSQGYTQAAWWNRIPIAAWVLMVAIAICSNALVGFGAASEKSKIFVIIVLPLVVSIAFLLIADLDSPRRGLIRQIPRNLVSLSQSLHAQPFETNVPPAIKAPE